MTRTTAEIVNIINSKAQEIVANISTESIDVYNFLTAQYAKTDVTTNFLFQFVYRSFYRLDNAGLTAQFKTEYFNIMQAYRPIEHFDFSTILRRLYDIQNHKGQSTFQFSFVTKMQNTIFDDKPIYDSEVARMFSFGQPKYGICFDDKLAFFLEQLQVIQQTYTTIIKNNSIQEAITSFDTKFQGNNLVPIKKLDFIFWCAGKIIRNFHQK
jgi:hypothetical protein